MHGVLNQRLNAASITALHYISFFFFFQAELYHKRIENIGTYKSSASGRREDKEMRERCYLSFSLLFLSYGPHPVNVQGTGGPR
jgi:hypothetical protein